MVPTTVLLDALANLLAADVGTLAAATALHVHLAKAAFTPGPQLQLVGLTEATFTGAAAKAAGTGSQQEFVDPSSGLRTIQMLEPAGGWHWLCTDTPTPAETIYGYYLTDTADAVLFASALVPSPILVNAAGQGLDLPQVRFTLPQNALS